MEAPPVSLSVGRLPMGAGRRSISCVNLYFNRAAAALSLTLLSCPTS